VEVLEELVHQFKIVRLKREPRKGAPAARNNGLADVTTDYVQFLDADDVLKPEKMESQMALLEQHNADAVCGAYIRQEPNGKEYLVEPNADVWKGLFTTRLGITSSCLFRTQTLREVNGWDENLTSSQEYELLFRLLKKGKKVILQMEPLTLVRERASGQISTSNPGKRWKQYIELRVEILEFLRANEKEYFNQNEPFFLQSFFDQIHIVYPYQSALARSLHRKYIANKFSPQLSPAISPSFMRMYKLLGFRWAEYIKVMLRS
jgi:glycosyltransferase involved in cell wall biosynthesis